MIELFINDLVRSNELGYFSDDSLKKELERRDRVREEKKSRIDKAKEVLSQLFDNFEILELSRDDTAKIKFMKNDKEGYANICLTKGKYY